MSPLIAIIGSGPSAFYAADFLLKQNFSVAMFERLPTPYGLVRGGVAPDHPKIKTVTALYERIASNPAFRFYGDVEYGRDLLHADLPRHFHAVIYATGAQTDRRMNIPGEDLPGSHAATAFVGWYNGHPDYADLSFDLSAEHAVVVGNGNVAMDVARILARTPAELRETDIADYALDALSCSRVRTISILGRRGPVQAAFTTPEIKELGELADADVMVPAADMQLDPLSAAVLESSADRTLSGNIETLRGYIDRPWQRTRQIIIRFLVSPVRLIGESSVEAVELAHNVLVAGADGSLRAQGTDRRETIPAGLVFRSIGYHGVALEGVPFDEKRGIIPNVMGRVLDESGAPLTGEYVTGWIKRGPSGVIGTNKPDSVETDSALMEDIAAGRLWTPESPSFAAIDALLNSRGVRVVDFADWKRLDALEIARGAAAGRPRVKFTHVQDMLDALDRTPALPSAAD